MKYSILFVSLFTLFGLSACDRPTTVVNVPATPAPVPGPAGPQGASGAQGAEGIQGETGKTGTDTVIVVPVPVEQK
jgi:hypothetical protein